MPLPKDTSGSRPLHDPLLRQSFRRYNPLSLLRLRLNHKQHRLHSNRYFASRAPSAIEFSPNDTPTSLYVARISQIIPVSSEFPSTLNTYTHISGTQLGKKGLLAPGNPSQVVSSALRVIRRLRKNTFYAG